MRVYCWRVGCVFDVESNVCPECGRTDHNIYTRNDCGDYAEVHNNKGDHCVLPRGHAGRHVHAAELEDYLLETASAVHDS